MKAIWTSLREFVPLVVTQWWATVTFVVCEVIAIVLLLREGMTVPLGVLIGIGVMAIIVAEFTVYNRVRLERDDALKRLATEGKRRSILERADRQAQELLQNFDILFYSDPSVLLTTESIAPLRARWGDHLEGLRDAIATPLHEMEIQCQERDIPYDILLEFRKVWKKLWEIPLAPNESFVGTTVFLAARKNVSPQMRDAVVDTVRRATNAIVSDLRSLGQ